MITSIHRFHGRGSLGFVYQRGRTVHGQLCALKYTRNPQRQDYRVAVVVSRKVHKSAVVRNRIRRRVYEIVRVAGITQAFDLVFMVYSDSLATMESAELQALIMAQLAKARIIPADPTHTP